MKFSLHPDAEQEFQAASEYYSDISGDLGQRFIVAIRSSFQTNRNAPERWPVLRNQTRRFVVRQFPYVILYRVSEKGIFVLAVMHQAREPHYWESRG